MINGDRRQIDDKRPDGVVSRREAAALFLALSGAIGIMPRNFLRSAIPDTMPASKSPAYHDGASTRLGGFGLVRFKNDAFPPIALQWIGEHLPFWVEQDDPGTPRSLEVAVVRERLPIYDHFDVEKAKRIMVVDEAIGNVRLPECLATIRGKSADLETIAETLVRSVAGQTIFGTDFAYYLESASFRLGRTTSEQGYATVVHGSYLEQLTRSKVQAAVQTLADMDFHGGLFVAVLIAEDRSSEPVHRRVPTAFFHNFDELLCALPPCTALAITGATRDAITVVAFDCRSEDRGDGISRKSGFTKIS